MRWRWFSILLVLSVHFAYAQDYNLHFSGLNINDGLSGNHARSIIRDKKWGGWIGTINGLNRIEHINESHPDSIIGTTYTPDIIRSIDIIIHPPFYKSFWFIFFVILSIVAITYYLYLNKVRRMAQQRKMLTLQVQQRTSELEKRNKRVVEQNKEIKVQRDFAKQQHTQIVKQKEELELHRHHLEKLIEARTKDLIKAKERAEQADALKTAFLANMSHEIRTPMNAIIGFLSILDDPDNTDEDRRSFVDLIKQSSASLLTIINDIIDLSKIEAGQLTIEYSDVNVNPILDNLYLLYQKKIQEVDKAIQLIIEMEQGALVVNTDKQRLQQVFTNLLDNALKFTTAGSIRFGYDFPDKAHVRFYVSDTGIGISKEHQNIIFERFRKVEHNQEKIYSGTGLGLAISKNLIELMGGEISVDSEPGKGAIFQFILPISHSENNRRFIAKRTQNESRSLHLDLSGKRILIAEDEETNYSFLYSALKKSNAIIDWAVDGEKALELFKQNKYHLILMDIKMPKMNGIDAFKNIRKIDKEIVVIAQTAFAFPEDIAKLNDVGFNEYLVKPIDTYQLIAYLNKYLAK